MVPNPYADADEGLLKIRDGNTVVVTKLVKKLRREELFSTKRRVLLLLCTEYPLLLGVVNASEELISARRQASWTRELLLIMIL